MSLVQTKLPEQCLGATVSKRTDSLLSDHHHRCLGNSALALERATQWTSHSDFTQYSFILLKSVACVIYLILEAMSLDYFWRVAA